MKTPCSGGGGLSGDGNNVNNLPQQSAGNQTLEKLSVCAQLISLRLMVFICRSS